MAALIVPAVADAQTASPIAGVWTLNRSLSDLPREIGFNPDMPSSSGGDESRQSGGGGRGRRSMGGGGAGRVPPGGFSGSPESYEDARRLQVLTGEVRNPPTRLMIVDGGTAVTVTNELGQSRTLHPTGKEESIEFQGVPLTVTTVRDRDRLVILYHVERDRDLRYTFSPVANPSRLVVDVQFLERGSGDKATLVYEPGIATETARSAGAATSAAPATAPAPEKFDERPGAELRGIKNVGILVEELSAQAAACGLSRDALEGALSNRLSGAGFIVRRNSDDDTYMYVNIMTATLGNGTCVSRYDAYLYTHATANLSYHEAPVLVQVSLMHRGGMSAGAPPTHGAAVTRGLEGYIDLFVTQVRNANTDK